MENGCETIMKQYKDWLDDISPFLNNDVTHEDLPLMTQVWAIRKFIKNELLKGEKE
jgi:hypothetical protein